GRYPRRAANEVRIHHQSKSSEANRLDDSTKCAGASGQSDQVSRGECEVSSESEAEKPHEEKNHGSDSLRYGPGALRSHLCGAAKEGLSNQLSIVDRPGC